MTSHCAELRRMLQELRQDVLDLEDARMAMRVEFTPRELKPLDDLINERHRKLDMIEKALG